jgi:hypothetical protein
MDGKAGARGSGETSMAGTSLLLRATRERRGSKVGADPPVSSMLHWNVFFPHDLLMI